MLDSEKRSWEHAELGMSSEIQGFGGQIFPQGVSSHPSPAQENEFNG